ncbi:hypothetical protein RJJ65_36330, partial [Rhizobium hidalgonense]
LLEYKRSLVLNVEERKKVEYYGQLKEFKTNLYTSAKSTAMQEEIAYWKNIKKFKNGNSIRDISEILPELQDPKTIKRIQEKALKQGDENFVFFFKGIKSKKELENWYSKNIQSKYNMFYKNKALVLDKFFIELLKCNILEYYMTLHFDENDIHSGAHYTSTITAIFGQMQQYELSYNYICSLLRGN